MGDPLYSAIDARQTPEWGHYMSKIGWISESIDNTHILIRPLKPFPWSMVKISHPVGPIPFAHIDKLAKKYHAFAVIIEPHIYKYDENSFKSNHYRVSAWRYAHTATIKINTAIAENDLFASFSENARRNIRKAEKLNLAVEIIALKNEHTDLHVKRFYSLLESLHQMKKFDIFSYEEYSKKINAFKETSYLLFAYSKNNKDPIGAVWIAHYQHVMSYLQTGITQEGYNMSANYLLVWEALKLAQKFKLDVFDFESIYDPRYPSDHVRWKGYTEFKKRFHGRLIEYPTSWIKLYNPFFKLLYLCFTTLP